MPMVDIQNRMPEQICLQQALDSAPRPPAPQGRAWRVFGCVLLAGLLGACAHGPESDVATQALRAPTPWDMASVGDALPAEQAPSAASRWQHLNRPGFRGGQLV